MEIKKIFILLVVGMMSFTNVHAQLEGRLGSRNPAETDDSEFQEMLQSRKTPEQLEKERQEQIQRERERMERKAAKEARKMEKQAEKAQKKADKAVEKARKED